MEKKELVSTMYWRVMLLPWACHVGAMECVPRLPGEVSQRALVQRSKLLIFLVEVLHYAFDPWLIDIRMRGQGTLIPFHHSARRLFGKRIAGTAWSDELQSVFMPVFLTNEDQLLVPDELEKLQKWLRQEMKDVILERYRLRNKNQPFADVVIDLRLS